MYKRRVNKTASLGISRTSTNKSITSPLENVNLTNSSLDSKAKWGSTSIGLYSPTGTSLDDVDQVLTDSEPSPKKSRIYASGHSFDSGTTSKIQMTRKKAIHSVKDNAVTVRQGKTKSQIVNTSNTESHVPINKPTTKFSIENKTPNMPRYLKDISEQAGLILSDGLSPNVLRADQAIFVRDMGNLIANAEQEKNIDRILKELEEYCKSDKCFKMSLSLTETASECEVARGATQDCLMRLLLHTDCLQAHVTQLLLDKLTKHVMEGTSDDGDTPPIAWVRMILQCFRFLDRVGSEDCLNERLLDVILASPDVTVQQELIISLPDIISDNHHHHAALELSKLVRKSPQLLASALEALTNLSLQPDVKAEIQPVLMKALHKVQPECLPAVLKYLITDSDPPLMDEIIIFLRNELDLAETEGDTASIQVLVYTTLRDVLLSSRTLANIWLKNISAVKSQVEHKPMDVLILLVLLSTTNDPVKQKSIESVFRTKIRSDMFTEALIDETLNMYTAVIKEYFQVGLKVAGTLLKSPDSIVIDFASKMYIGMFVYLDGLWSKWVLTDLQVCVGAGDANIVRSALNVLQHLTNNYHDKVKPLGILLMQLINKLNDLVLSEVCQLMDILCHIAYSDDNPSLSDHSILKDEINILIQKQLGSSQLSVLRNGVVGCIMTIKHIATTENTSSESVYLNESSDKTKKAIQLLEILLASTRHCVEAHGLALDQLSHLLLSGSSIDPSFIQKLSGLMRDNLQDIYLIATSDFSCKGDIIESSLQFYLDDEDEGAIALNLCDLVVAEANSRQVRAVTSVSCVHPLLRLLRGLELGDLSQIDALLGCAVNMPHPSVYTDFSHLTAYQQHVALNCLFHCINWFMEIINCFAYLIKNNESEKVLVRLRTVVWLRGLLVRYLPLAIEYTPPMCHFHFLPKPKVNSSEKKGVKRKRKQTRKKKTDKEAGDMTNNENTSQLEEDEEVETTVESEADLSKYKYCFRELDIDVWLILTQQLTLSPTPERNGQFSAELGPTELLFVLGDYVTKLSRALTSSNKRMSFLKAKTLTNQSIGFENLDKFSSLHLVKNTVKLLSNLCSFLEKIMEYTQNLVRVNEGMDCTGMFIEGSAEIKLCQGKLLKILAILFSWFGFQNQVNNNLLIAGLQKVACRVNSEHSKTKSKKLLVRECIQYFIQCEEHVLDLASASSLVDLLKALAHHTEGGQSKVNDIACLCEKLLRRRWYDLKGNREKGASLNNQVSELLNSYLLYSEDQLTVVTNTLGWLASETQLSSNKNAKLTTFPSFSKVNLHIVIRSLLKGLEGAVKQKLELEPSDKDQLDMWTTFTQDLEVLVTIMKTVDSKPILRVFMKGCTPVLKMFLSHGMSICTCMFKHEPAVVSQILKKLQVTTRYIQTICNYVKVSKDTTLTQFLPPVRAVLETIILRVKSIIVINNCSDAFFMGSMKNRDLKGQEIPSQETQEEDDETNGNGSDSDKLVNADGGSDEENEDAEENVSLLY